MGRRAAVRALDRIVRLSEGSRTASTSSGARAFPNSSTGLFGAQPSAVITPAAAWTGSKANRSALAQPVEEASPVPDTRVDAYGAVSVISEEDAEFEDDVYRNIDGRRFEDGRYAAFINEISAFIPKSRQFTDPVRTFAYGTDASFYRLNPKLVVKVHNEQELQRILPIAEQLAVPVTFRAAGTSLSGQAITDSVLLKLSHTGKNFRSYEIHGDGSTITVEPGLIGGEINRILARHKAKHNHPIQYKIGPDPSSIDSCMVGGMVSNNSSGMCCGVSQNTYHTLKDMRIVFLDGTVLDTSDASSREAFLQSHKELVAGVLDLASRVQHDKQLTALIRRKFAIKCTTGYSLNALVDFSLDDPIEIIKRLMIGSEGTFGFVSQATYNCVPEWPHKASSFMMFPDMNTACRAASVLRTETAVDAVEVFDRAALRECEADEGLTKLVVDIKGADPGAAALLIECRGEDAETLQERIDECKGALTIANVAFGAKRAEPKDVDTYGFKKDPKDFNVYWDVRKGLIPIVGGARETGTSMLIEDVACPVDKLGDMTQDLVDMFQKFGYKDASCFGHALEGNLHLVFSQGFRSPEEVQRFSDMMEEMCYIVATKHSGSLKGEHGTGRNVAPFVEMEWGSKAYDLMWDLKALFDPNFVLNPGVVLNKDPDLHVKHLKPSPAASSIVNRCIECGFCESNCPSRDITLTPRQRITTYREISRLRDIGERTDAQQQRLTDFEKSYDYDGDATCAADGMCQVKCPVKINTGELIKQLRSDELEGGDHPRATKGAMTLANNFGAFAAAMPPLLNSIDLIHRVVGPKPLEFISRNLNKMSGNIIPVWSPSIPKGASKLNMHPRVPEQPKKGLPRQVVYAPACVTRMMGPASSDTEQGSVHEKLLSLFDKAGYEVIYPEGLSGSCCGMLFNSRGFKGAASHMGQQLEQSLIKASDGGKIPIVMDTSPCLAQMKGALTDPALRFNLYEPVEFISRHLMDKLEWSQVRDNVAVHVPCSSKKMGIEAAFNAVAQKCSKQITPSEVPCCGMAGDRGMRYPELTGAALQHLQTNGCTDGYSTSRTCEISLSNHSGINFRGLVYLADEATKPKAQQQQSV